MNYKNMGKKIKSRRLYLKYTQKDIAELAGIPQSMISMVESGERKLSLDIVKKLADPLEFGSLAEFFTYLKL